MIAAFFVRYGVQLLLVAALLGGLGTALYSGYRHIYNKGYTEAQVATTQKYEKALSDERERILKVVTAIESYSTAIVIQNEAIREVLAKDLSTIIKLARTKPTIIVENNKCVLSKEFLDSYNQLIQRGNQK